MVRVSKENFNGVELRRESKYQCTSIKTPLYISNLYLSGAGVYRNRVSGSKLKINKIIINKKLKDIIY